VACRSVCHSSEPCKIAEPIEMPFRLWARMGPRNHELDGGPDPPRDGAILGKGSPWVVDTGAPKEARVQLNSPGANVPHGSLGGHIGATWRIRFNHPSAAAMRSYVKLLDHLFYIDTNFSRLWPNSASQLSLLLRKTLYLSIAR